MSNDKTAEVASKYGITDKDELAYAIKWEAAAEAEGIDRTRTNRTSVGYVPINHNLKSLTAKQVQILDALENEGN